MSGLSHTTHQNRFFGLKLDWVSFPAAWPWKQVKAEQSEAEPQILTEDQPLPPSERLIVIVPDAISDLLSLPRRIWNLAAPDCRQVLLLIQPFREENEYYARMNLTTLAAMIRDPRVVVHTQLVLGQSIEQAAREYAQPDDVFVCFEEHQVSGFMRKHLLSGILAQKTHCPVYTLKGTIPEMAGQGPARLANFLILALCLVSIIAFFALGVWIDRNSTGVSHTILQILAVIAETWFIGMVATKSFRI